MIQCQKCDREIRLEQKSVRYEGKWYHIECFKETLAPRKKQQNPSTITARPPEQKKQAQVYKGTVLSEQIYKTQSQQKKPEPVIKTSIKTIPSELNLDHVKKEPIQELPKSILQKPTTDIQKSTPKQVIPDTKPKSVKSHKMRPDPVLIVLAIAIFSLLIFAAYTIYTILSALAIGTAAIIAFYHILSRKSPNTKHKYEAKGASFYSIAILVLPFAFGLVNAVDVSGLFESIFGFAKYGVPQNSTLHTIHGFDPNYSVLTVIQAVFIWSLTLSFWQTMLFVPLAIRSATRESQLTDPEAWPKISVLIPAYNEEKVIRTTIESLLATDYPEKEIIVIDDGSKDQTLYIASQYKDRIKLIHKENGGKASALNQGLLYATGDIVTIVDADTIIGNSSLKHIARGMAQENVAAVAGNVKIRNKVNWLTWCQALEYLSGIQIMRRGLDYFGAITIVPGALGTFRKKSLEEAGTYHKETLVEDFDATMKVLRSGMVVSASNKATAYTQAPQKLRDFWKQRKRWYRGNLQVLRRHSDVLLNPRFGYLHRMSYPLMAIHMLVVPIASIMVWGFAIYQLILGQYLFVVYTFGMYIALQYLLSAMAVRMDRDEKKMILYSVFLVIGYKQIIDFMQVKAVFEELFGKKAIWTSAERVKQ